MFGCPETDILAHTVCGRMCSNGPLGNRTHFWMTWCRNPWFGLLRCFLLLVSLNNILLLKLHFQVYICFAFVSEVTSRCRNSACRNNARRNNACRNKACTPYLVTGALITSELKFMTDYRTLGLSNPRIIDT